MNRIADRFENVQNPFIAAALKHSSRYLGVSVVTSVVGVIMNKYYTNVFSPSEYGVLAFYTILCQYLQNLFGFTVDSAAQRVYFDYKGEDLKDFLGTVTLFLLGSSLFWSLLVVIFVRAPYIKYFGGDNYLFYSTVALTLLFTYFNFINKIGYNEQLSRLIFRQSVVQSVVNHGSSIVMISLCGWGIVSRQISQAAAYGVNLVSYIRELRKHDFAINIRFRTDILRRISHFAIPSFAAAVLSASFGYIDRVLINHYYGKYLVGIFSLSFAIAQLLSFFVESISAAAIPTIMKELESDYSANLSKLKQSDKYFCISLLLIAFIVFIFSDLLIALFSNTQYQRSANVLPFIVMGYVMGGFYKGVSGVLLFHSIVWFYPILTIVSFSSSTLLNLVLIQKYQEMGAGYSFFVGMLIYSLLMHVLGSKYYFSLKKISFIYAVIFAVVSGLFFHKVGVL